MGNPAWPVYTAADADSLGFCVLPGPQLPSSALKPRPFPSSARPSHSRFPSGPLSTLAGMESELAGGSEHRPPSFIICTVRATKKGGSEMFMGFSFPEQLSPGEQMAV